MKEYADLVLASIIAHDATALPLAPRYRATENSVPAALTQMTAWRLGDEVIARGLTVADPELGQLVFTANLRIAGAPAAFWARVAVVDGLIAEVEVSHAQSAADGGYVLLSDEIGDEPDAWRVAVPESGRATRDELLALGRGVFLDADYQAPENGPEAWVMEQGGIVREDAEFTDLAFGDGTGDIEAGERKPIVAGLPPFRPRDPAARVVAVDEEAGMVVTIGTVPGYVMPTVTSTSNTSAFVPASMHDLHARSILPKRLEGRSVVREAPVSCVSTQILRLFDGRLQGMQMFNRLTAHGTAQIWDGD